MANNKGSKESSPLLSKQVGVKEDEKKKLTAFGIGWTANGLPLVHGSVVGEPMGRSPWDSSLFDCLGRNDFSSTDIEVCKSLYTYYYYDTFELYAFSTVGFAND